MQFALGQTGVFSDISQRNLNMVKEFIVVELTVAWEER